MIKLLHVHTVPQNLLNEEYYVIGTNDIPSVYQKMFTYLVTMVTVIEI